MPTEGLHAYKYNTKYMQQIDYFNQSMHLLYSSSVVSIT